VSRERCDAEAATENEASNLNDGNAIIKEQITVESVGKSKNQASVIAYAQQE
jgi:hypothetical protein